MEQKILDELIISEQKKLTQKRNEIITSGAFSRYFNTYGYRLKKAEFEDYIQDNWKWSMLKALNDTISEPIYNSIKALDASQFMNVKSVSRYEDKGGFAMRESFGEVFLCLIECFCTYTDYDSDGSKSTEERYEDGGLLVYFPGVMKHPAKADLIVATNKKTDDDEISERLGIGKSFTDPLASFLLSAAESCLGIKNNGVEVENKEFAHHFKPKCADLAYAGYALTNDYMEHMLKLRTMFGKSISISYIGSDIYLFIHSVDDFIRVFYQDKEVEIEREGAYRMNMIMNHLSDLKDMLLFD